MALPFVYRALDAGLARRRRAHPRRGRPQLRRELAAGARPAVLPNLRGALLNASFLTLALVLGEYTVASLLGYQPFAVWISTSAAQQAQMSVAVSVLSLFVTWVLLLALAVFGGRSRTASASRG